MNIFSCFCEEIKDSIAFITLIDEEGEESTAEIDAVKLTEKGLGAYSYFDLKMENGKMEVVVDDKPLEQKEFNFMEEAMKMILQLKLSEEEKLIIFGGKNGIHN